MQWNQGAMPHSRPGLDARSSPETPDWNAAQLFGLATFHRRPAIWPISLARAASERICACP
jgi:hypothetical protein